MAINLKHIDIFNQLKFKILIKISILKHISLYLYIYYKIHNIDIVNLEYLTLLTIVNYVYVIVLLTRKVYVINYQISHIFYCINL